MWKSSYIEIQSYQFTKKLKMEKLAKVKTVASQTEIDLQKRNVD